MITRRVLLGGVAGACWPRKKCLVLEAIAAERMPQRMVVRGVERAAYFELRDYGEAGDRVAEVLTERGVRPVLQDRGRLLFAFESLVERERTWREAGEIRQSAVVREITIYKTISPRDLERAEKTSLHG